VIWLLAGTLLPSGIAACALCYLVRHYALRWKLLDQPSARKVHTSPTPLGGGLAIYAGVVLPLACGQLLLWLIQRGILDDRWLPPFVAQHVAGLWQQSRDLWLLLAGGTVLMLLGLVDDRRNLDWRFRIGVQFAVAIGVVLSGWKLTLFIEVPLVTDVISVLWIVGLVNSFNMLDNMDGLSAGVAAIAATMLATVMLMAPDPVTSQPQLFVGGLLFVLVGSLLGFLWHNRPPAKLFMGDAGSYFVGYLVAICTLLATYSSIDAPRHAILAPLCVLAVPLYDTITVVAIRLRRGHSPFHADRNHFSHRLVELGLTKPQAVWTIYLTTAATGLGALLLYQVNAAGAGVILLMVLCVLAVIAILEQTGRRRRGE
jgi:UDP-GlcNAc:undecaprenyl-phosphate GlcNAc-1-phosphate transferase